MANSHDPHRPFFGSDQEQRMFGDRVTRTKQPSRVYRPGEVEVPGFLPDLREVRREIAEYASSVRRLDDTVGELLAALEESGQADNTLVMFISDNGMALPFSKTNCYLHSTRTPWIVRWPGRVRAGRFDRRHFISGIDFMPTILAAAGIAGPDGMDGRSFLNLLKTGEASGRDCVHTVFHETAAGRRYEMRCVQDKRFGYIFNAWANGRTRFLNESQSGRSFAAMQRAAGRDDAIRARVEHFLHRTPEELYDFAADPDALVNLVDDEPRRRELEAKRSDLLEWMRRTADPLLRQYEAFLSSVK
jgi:N-sulfoglucosamine sulfohydrolase